MAVLPPLPALMAFECVARRRSFSLAATEQHLTPSAISHQVSRLEAILGVRLFERNAHGVHLSAAGEQYLLKISGALAAISTATEGLRHGVDSTLAVHSAPSIASLWLMPRLRGFAQACPDISLSLSAAHTLSDFTLGQADIDIRYGIPPWGDLVVEPLFEERIIPLASPEFIKEHRLRRVEQLSNIPLIQSRVSVIQWSDWFRDFSNAQAPVVFPLRFDRAQMALDAATQGLGVALESTTIAGGHIENGSLRPVFGLDQCVRVKAHFAVYPTRHAGRPAVEAFLAWLHGEAAKAENGSRLSAKRPSSRR